MKSFVKIALVLLVVSIMAVGCKKKEEQPVPKAPMQAPMQTPMSPHGDGGMAPKTEKTVVVPDIVKGKWSKVKLVLEDKTSKKSSEYAVNLKSELKIPNTNLKVVVGDFLPDFKMGESTLTSGSNEPNNPAVNVEVFEDGKSIFKGWLFAKFPTMHPLEHAKYALTLKEGVRS
ncbi:MAG: DUF2155 domain-containing protein [Nitrospirae bacterium]|nr:DUF2155 domain-containing protein [Nitrospirota bacterium]